MKTALQIFAIAAVIFISGCATSYHSTGFTGGYSETQLAPDVFRIHFAGNGYTSGERAQDFAMLRAADLALQHGFKYFAIIDESSSTAVSSFTTPGSATTTGSAYVSGGYGNYYGSYSDQTTYTPPQTYYVFKPRAGLLIRCFTDKPEAIYTFDAVFLQQSLKQKYHITTPAAGPAGVVNLTSPDNPSSTNATRLPVIQEFSDSTNSEAVPSGTNNETASDLAPVKALAEKGDATFQLILGMKYEEGDGVPKDMAEAARWYRMAAEQGDADAQSSLGVCYYKGEGVVKDASEAAKWWRKAAEKGYAAAQCNLGLCYAKGEGVPQDYAEALKWYRKAAEQGDSNSQCKLGIAFEDGKGVPQDYIESYKWYNLAAAGSETNASLFRSSLAEKMTPEQIAEAQRLSREFKPRKESGSDNSTSLENSTASGTGFFITDDGYLISNNHVVKNATKVRLLTSTGLIDAKVVQVDEANDLALLKAEGRFAPLPIVASRAVKLGGVVATVGFPNIGLQGFAPKLAKGEIASLSGASDDARYFQISVPVQPGNSGGALVDERGNVVGIVSAKLSAKAALAESGALPENVNYAVKSSFLLSFLESVPDVSAKLKEPNTQDEKFEDAVKSAQSAAVLVLVY